MSLPDFERVLRTYERTKSPLTRWLPANEIDELGKRLHVKALEMQPRIMVYGVYNAGKSTLLNALMGSAEAPMSDRPETSKITPYSWHGYTLLDTPGTDAPVADEEVTRAELERCDVVLFVIATGGSIDEDGTWQELLKIVDRGRRVMLIVNNKSGLEPDSNEFLAIADKLRSNLQDAAETAGMKDVWKEVSISLINARTALKGRLENKQALIERSGILTLESNLAEFLSTCDCHTVFNSCRIDLLDTVVAAEIALQAKNGNAASLKLTTSRQKISNERERLDCALKEDLEDLLLKAQRKMTSSIGHSAKENDNALAQAQMENAASEIAVNVGEKLNASVERELPTTQRNLREIGEVLNIELNAANASIHLSAGESSDEGGDSMVGQKIKETAQKMPIGDLTEKGAKVALAFGKDTFPKLFKGIGEKTMGRWAGTAGKAVGPVLAVGMFAWDLYQSHQEAAAQKRAIERHAQAIEDAVGEFIGNLRDNYCLRITELVDKVFLPLEDWLAVEEKTASGQQESVRGDQLLFTQASAALRV